jgi:nucleoside-diphosphate-sugar epimerase
LGTVFNIGTGQNHSINELSKFYNSEILYLPSRVGESRETLADNSKAKEFLKWNPQRSLKDWILKGE